MKIIGLKLRRPPHPSGDENANKVFVNTDQIVAIRNDSQWSNGSEVLLSGAFILHVLEDKFAILDLIDDYESERLNRLLPE